MSERSLPADWRQWPRNPYALLGVAPGVSAKDLRRAYVRLIKTYKPEHEPDAFRLIRLAYESIEPYAVRESTVAAEPETRAASGGPPPNGFTQGELHEPAAGGDDTPPDEPPPGSRSIVIDTVARVVPEPAETDLPDSSSRPAPANHPAAGSPQAPFETDPWDLALAGDFDRAISELQHTIERAPQNVCARLRLYWLELLNPAFGADPAPSPALHLVRGLIAQGSMNWELFQRLDHDCEFNPQLASGAETAGLLGRAIEPDLVLHFARIRWRAHRRLGRFELIPGELEAIRPRAATDFFDAWPDLLIAAVTQMIWAPRRELRKIGFSYVGELEGLQTLRADLPESLYRIDLGGEVASKLRAIKGRGDSANLIRSIVAESWDASPFRAQRDMFELVARFAADPLRALKLLDRIKTRSAPVLGALRFAMEQFGWIYPDVRDTRTDAQKIYPVRIFLGKTNWTSYPQTRKKVLVFCYNESISPMELADFITRHNASDDVGLAAVAERIRGDAPVHIVDLARRQARRAAIFASPRL